MRRKNRLKVLLVIFGLNIYHVPVQQHFFWQDFRKVRERHKEERSNGSAGKSADSSTYGSSCDTVSESDTEANSDTNADTKRKSKF